MVTEVTKKTSLKSDRDTIAGYVHDSAMDQPHRAAHFLDWYARTAPGRTAPYPLILKAIMGYAQMPRPGSVEVEQLRGRMQRVGQLLLRDYQRRLICEPGLGARATSDSSDVVEHALARDTRRFVSARNRVQATLSVVDPSKVAGARLQGFYREAAQAVKLLGEERITKLLLPPAPKDAGK